MSATIVPAPSSYGPAMQALTEKQRAFVIAMCETGGHNHSACARAAGYIGTDEAMKTNGYRLSHDPAVLAAIREEGDRRMRAGAILAASTLIKICGNDMHKDQYKAAVELLNRAGLLVVTEHKVTVENTSEKDMLARIQLLAKSLDIDPAKLLGSAGAQLALPAPIDAEFEEVTVDEELFSPL